MQELWCEFHLSTEFFEYIFQKRMSIILFMFIHNSSSKISRTTTASTLLTYRVSAGCDGEFLQF